MYDTTYSTDSMEFIAIIVQPLRGAVSPIGKCISVVPAHDTAFRTCILAYFYGFGINAEHIFGSINGYGYIPADFLSKPSRQLASAIELSAADQVWQILLALIVQTMKKKIFTIEPEGLGCYAESDYFEVGKLGDYATSGHVSVFIDTISGEIFADSKDSYEICYEVAHKQCDST